VSHIFAVDVHYSNRVTLWPAIRSILYRLRKRRQIKRRLKEEENVTDDDMKLWHLPDSFDSSK
jgi:hypothetical protein